MTTTLDHLDDAEIPTVEPTLVHIGLDHLHPADDNPRTDLGQLEELADTIEQHGILEPLVVIERQVCGAKHPTSWWITCQLDTDHFGEHVRDCPPVEVGERLKFSQLTVHWQDPCECDSHTGVGEDLWKCDECGEVIRYVDDPQGRVVVTTLHPYNDRRVRVEMVTPGDRPGNREWWT